MCRNIVAILPWLCLLNHVTCDAQATYDSMIYMYEEGTGIPFYCTFGTEIFIQESPVSVQRECLKRHNGMVHILSDGTPTYPFLKYGTPGGIVLECVANIKHGSFATSCYNRLVHSACQFTCDPGYRSVKRSDPSPSETNDSTASCDLTGPMSNISVGWSHMCEYDVSSTLQTNLEPKAMMPIEDDTKPVNKDYSTERSPYKLPSDMPATNTTESTSLHPKTKNEDLSLKTFLAWLVFAVILILAIIFILGVAHIIRNKGSYCKTERCLTPTDSTRSDLATAVSSSQSVEKGTDPITIPEDRIPSIKTLSSTPSNFGKDLIDDGANESNLKSKEGSVIVGLTDLHINDCPSGVLQVGETMELVERNLSYQGQAHKEDDMADPPTDGECCQPLLANKTAEVEGSAQSNLSSSLSSLVEKWKEPLSTNDQVISMNILDVLARGASPVPPSPLSVDEIKKILDRKEEEKWTVSDVDEDRPVDSIALSTLTATNSMNKMIELLKTEEEGDSLDGNEAEMSVISVNLLPGCNVRELKKATDTDYQAILDELEPQSERKADITLEGYFLQTHEQLQRLGFRDRDHYELKRRKYRERPDWDFSRHLMDKMAQHGDTIPNLVEYLKNRNPKALNLITKVHICDDCSKHY